MNKMKVMFFLGVLVLVAVVLGGLWISKQKNTVTSEPITTTDNATKPTQKQTIPSDVQTIKEQAIRLTVIAPTDQSVSSVSTVSVQGNTVPNAEVSVNDKEVKADSAGNFSVSITLDEGENTIMVVANDADGKAVEKDIVVTYVPAQ